MKKKRNGFTLVELLAVIVILAIIMIIAIPAVLETMQTAKKKAMVEYAQKVMNKAEEKYLESLTLGESMVTAAEETYIYYDIRKDLGLNNTGSYFGTAFLIIRQDDNKYYRGVSIFTDEYSLMYRDSTTSRRELDIKDISDAGAVSNGMKAFGYTVETFPAKQVEMYVGLHKITHWFSIGVVDGATGQQVGDINERVASSWDGTTLIASENAFEIRGEGLQRIHDGYNIYS